MEVLRYKSEDGVVEIKVATSSITSSWQRFSSRLGDKSLTYCDYKSSRLGWLFLSDVNNQEESPVLIGNSNEPSSEWLLQPPVFFETNIYSFTLRFNGIEEKPTIIHTNRNIEDQFNWFADQSQCGGILTGSIDFLNEPGIFPLRFRYKPINQHERTDTLEFRIVSPKLDVKEDYLHILNTINAEYSNLVFKFLTKTFQSFQLSKTKNNHLIWLTIFRTIIDNYIQAMEFIVNKPHIREKTQVLFGRADCIKKWTPQMEEQFSRVQSEQMLNNHLFRHEVQDSTFDTQENRFVKFTIENISERLKIIINELLQYSEEELSASEKSQLRTYQSRLNILYYNRFFRGIGRFDGFKQESLVLQKRTGYRDIYRTWLLLDKSINLFEGYTQIGTRPIWELYELWCFLKMKHLIADILGIDRWNNKEESIIESKSTVFDPFKNNVTEHRVVFQRSSDSDKIELIYQRTYSRFSGEIHTATTEQRPDIVLNIHKPSGLTLTYLYDAKYRVLDDKNASTINSEKTDFADYPPPDAINQMHRYRDAIYYGTGNEWKGAVVVDL